MVKNDWYLEGIFFILLNRDMDMNKNIMKPISNEQVETILKSNDGSNSTSSVIKSSETYENGEPTKKTVNKKQQNSRNKY